MDLKIITIEDIVIIEAPTGVCLYSKAAQAMINQLVGLVEKLQNDQKEEKNFPKAVVLLQLEDCSDFVESWESELKYEGTQRQTYENILEFRWLLYLIRHSIVPWYYMNLGDVLGSHWELALSCTYRYSFAADVTFGFPEIAAGVFVAGGILESLAKHGVRSKDKWQAQHTILVNQALREGLIHYYVPGALRLNQPIEPSFLDKNFYSEINLLLKKRLGNKSQSQTRHSTGLSTFVRNNPIDLFIKKSSSSKLSRIDPILKEEFYHEFQYKASEYLYQSQKSNVTAWSYCWEIVKERTSLEKTLNSAAAVARVAALAFYGRSYINWLERQRSITGLYKKYKKQISPGSSDKYAVSIDISEGYPPIESLIKFAERQVVTFQARSSGVEFKQSLEILFTRLDRTLGHAAASKLWGTQILWTQNEFNSPNFIKLKWRGYDRLYCQIGNRVDVKIFRPIGVDLGGISANYFVAGGDSWDPDLDRILHMVSPGIIYIKSSNGLIPWESVFRSLVLEELIRLARSSGGDLSKLCENLRKLGWGFVADEDAWSYFLKAPEDLIAFKSGQQDIDKLIHDNSQFLWEIGSWKQARTLARKDATEVFNNPVMQSRKLAFFIARVTSLVLKVLPADDVNAIDQIAMISLGFPASYHSPLGYLNALGERREKWLRLKYGS
jgi:enoyl-CoA hydratase/carnithine racemase